MVLTLAIMIKPLSAALVCPCGESDGLPHRDSQYKNERKITPTPAETTAHEQLQQIIFLPPHTPVDNMHWNDFQNAYLAL